MFSILIKEEKKMGKGYIKDLSYNELCYYEDGYIYTDRWKSRTIGRYENGSLYEGNSTWGSAICEYEGNYVKPKGYLSIGCLLTVKDGDVYNGPDGGYVFHTYPIAKANIIEGGEDEAACAAFIVFKDTLNNTTSGASDSSYSSSYSSYSSSYSGYSGTGGSNLSSGCLIAILIAVVLIAIFIVIPFIVANQTFFVFFGLMFFFLWLGSLFGG